MGEGEGGNERGIQLWHWYLSGGGEEVVVLCPREDGDL